jgi:hypothetical protein
MGCNHDEHHAFDHSYRSLEGITALGCRASVNRSVKNLWGFSAWVGYLSIMKHKKLYFAGLLALVGVAACGTSSEGQLPTPR